MKTTAKRITIFILVSILLILSFITKNTLLVNASEATNTNTDTIATIDLTEVDPTYTIIDDPIIEYKHIETVLPNSKHKFDKLIPEDSDWQLYMGTGTTRASMKAINTSSTYTRINSNWKLTNTYKTSAYNLEKGDKIVYTYYVRRYDKNNNSTYKTYSYTSTAKNNMNTCRLSKTWNLTTRNNDYKIVTYCSISSYDKNGNFLNSRYTSPVVTIVRK